MRTTKLSTFCDYVIEAGWLAAVITVPLFFNVYSSRVFEPDKLTLLRSIALFMALAWVVKVLDTGLGLAPDAGGGRRRQSEAGIAHYVSRIASLIRSTPLVLPTLLLVAVYILSTITSVAPRISLWGSYQRLQGTYTTLAYVIIFLLVLQGLRTREQLNRLITATILASLPVALYGLIQHYGLDPLPWLGDVQKRVASSMGNSIFVAAYLIMVAPLTLYRLLESFADLVETEDNLIPPFIESTGYLFIFLAQLLAIFFSQSRGPWLGLLSAFFVFWLIWAVTRGNRRLVFGIIGVALLGASFLVVLNVPNTPLEPIRQMPYIGRLGQVFETSTGTGRVRVLIWEGTTDLVTADPFRAVVGYGPETMHMAYNPYYPPELAHYEARNASPDRAHNETFDALVITGVIGFAAYLFLFVSLFYYGLKWLGLVQNSTQRNLLLAFIAAGGLLSVAGFRLADGTNRFFGVALPAGMIVGLFAYLVWATVFPHDTAEGTEMYGREGAGADRPFTLILIGLLAAIIGHFVEIHFGIAIAATRTLFWTYAAVMVVIGYLVHQRPELTAEPAPQPAPARSKGRGRRGRRANNDTDAGWPWRPALTVAGIGSFIMITLAYDFVTNPAREDSALAIVWHTLSSRWVNDQATLSPATMWLVLMIWLVIGFLGLAMVARQSAGGGNDVGWWLRGSAIYTAATSVIFLGFSLITAAHLVPRSGRTLDQAVGRLANHVTLYYVALFVGLITMAGILAWRQSTSGRWWSGRWPVLLSPLLAIVVFLIIGNTNLEVVQADILYKQAWNGYHSRGQYDAAIATYRQALELQPQEDYYYLFLGKAYLEKIQSVQDPAERERLFDASRQALERAQQLNPLNPDHAANLARLYQQWGQVTQEPEQRQELMETALQYHRQATQLAPNAAHLYNEWAITLDQMGRTGEAVEKLEKSKSLDPIFANTFMVLGDVYGHNGQTEQAIAAYQEALELDSGHANTNLRLASLYEYQGQVDKAVEQYRSLIEERPNNLTAHQRLAILYYRQGQLAAAQREAETAAQLPGTDPSTFLILGDIYRTQGEMQQAIGAYEQALTLNPQAVEAYGGLALAHQALGDLPSALENAQEALNLAPDNESLQALVEDLQGRTP